MVRRATSTAVGLAVLAQKAGAAVGEKIARAVSVVLVTVLILPVMTALKTTVRAISTVEEHAAHPARWGGVASSTAIAKVDSVARASALLPLVKTRFRTKMRSRRTVVAPAVFALWRASAGEAPSVRVDGVSQAAALRRAVTMRSKIRESAR